MREAGGVPLSAYYRCPVCGAGDSYLFFELGDMPINVCVQWSTRQKALSCPKGDIKLAFCKECGFIWNCIFDPLKLDYTQAYENSLFFSPLFEQYSKSLARRLIDRYGLQNKKVIDIGCGKGDFLFLLCSLGNNDGVGFDTSYEGTPQSDLATAGRVTIIRDFYSKKYANYAGDLICSRYVLEHIERPKTFLEVIRDSIGSRQNATVYFEVPNVSLILRDLSVWDIIYEHCSYFGISSLKYVFALCGFETLDAYESYEGQFIGIEARPSERRKPLEGNAGEMAAEVDSFVHNYRNQLEMWQDRLEMIEKTGKRAVLWGAGAKGVSFLNMLKFGANTEYIVDINTRKQGKFVAGTGQKIVPPEFLTAYKPDFLILPNPIYREEISATIKKLGINTEIL